MISSRHNSVKFKEVRMDDNMIKAILLKHGSPYLNTDQAAFYVSVSPKTLAKMRVKGGGPKYRKHGRQVRYHVQDLDDWSTKRLKISSSDVSH